MEHGRIVKLGDWINEGWNLYSKAWKTWSLMGAIAMLPVALFIIVFYIAYIIFLVSLPYRNSISGRGILITLVLFFGAGFFLFLYIVYVESGMFLAARKQIHGESVAVSDIWKGGRFIIPLILLYMVNIVLIWIGALLCFFPAFIVQGLVFLSHPILIYENCGPIEAVKKSWNLAKNDWIMFTLFALVVGLISQIGIYACVVGICITFPLRFTMAAVAYRDCFESGDGALSTATSGAAKTCKNCGKTISSNVNFCSSCGASQA